MRTLIVRAMLGLVFLVVVLGLALFISAGTLRFWHAWAYLAVFALCTLLITLYLIRYDQQLLSRRVQAGPLAETQRSQQLIQSLANLLFLGLFIVPGLDARFHWSQVPPAVSVLADALVALGFWIVFLVFRENSYTSNVIEVAQAQPVITTGPYSVVRHPMYAGAILLLIVTPPALGSWVALPCVLPLILVIAVRLRAEETFLRTHLRGYEAYRQRVRYRLVPFIW